MATKVQVGKKPPVTAGPPEQTALLLDRFETGADPNGTSAQANVMAGPFNRRALVLANAYGSSRYEGPGANAGIVVTLSGGGESVDDDSFEAQSHRLTFHAQASLMFVLNAGESREVETNVSPIGAGGQARNRQTSVRLHVTAIAV